MRQKWSETRLVSLDWWSWWQVGRVLPTNKALWYACSRMAQWFTSNSSGRCGHTKGLLSLVRKMLSMEKQHKSQKLWSLLRLRIAKTTCVFTALLRWVQTFLDDLVCRWFDLKWLSWNTNQWWLGLFLGQASECKSYKALDQADRAVGNRAQNNLKCDGRAPDNIVSPAWYRMTGASGDKIPNKCVPKNRCGTHAPGWLNGSHPAVLEGVVNRQVCYHWSSSCCNWKNNIKIRNCGSYYVYQLIKPPVCYLRYCGNKEGECLFAFLVKR